MKESLHRWAVLAYFYLSMAGAAFSRIQRRRARRHSRHPADMWPW